MTSLLDHGRSLQHVIGDLSTLVVRDLVALFTQHGDADQFPELLRKSFGSIVRPYADAAGTVTAQWYRELSFGSDYRPTPFVDLPDERLDKTLDWALNAPGDANPLDRLAGSSKRMVADASRTTVVRNADAEGVRWARLAAEDACEFCKLLALRGATYRGYGVQTEDPGFAAQKVRRLVVVGRNGRPRGSRQIGESYHDHCRCVAVPVRAGTLWKPPAYTKQWGDEYRDAAKAAKSGDLKSILAQWRANTRAQNASDTADDDVPQPVDLDKPAHV